MFLDRSGDVVSIEELPKRDLDEARIADANALPAQICANVIDVGQKVRWEYARDPLERLVDRRLLGGRLF